MKVFVGFLSNLQQKYFIVRPIDKYNLLGISNNIFRVISDQILHINDVITTINIDQFSQNLFE